MTDAKTNRYFNLVFFLIRDICTEFLVPPAESDDSLQTCQMNDDQDIDSQTNRHRLLLHFFGDYRSAFYDFERDVFFWLQEPAQFPTGSEFPRDAKEKRQIMNHE